MMDVFNARMVLYPLGCKTIGKGKAHRLKKNNENIAY